MQGVSGLAGAAAGGIAGLAGAALPGPEGQGVEWLRETQKALTYKPRTSAGELISSLSAEPMELASKVAGTIGGKVGARISPKAEIAGQSIGEVVPAAAATLLGGKYALKQAALAPEAAAAAKRSLGAAELEQAKLRRARAQELEVPIDLTKGQAERTFQQQRFERETAKLPEGAPLRERFAEQNERILKNFDAWVDETGAEKAGNLRAVGEAVNQAVVDKANRAKSRVKQAYNAAREAGAMQDPVSYQNVRQFIEQQTPTTREKLAPILNAVEEQLKLNDPKNTGMITINQMEDIRKLVNKTAQPGTPNEAFGIDLKNAIDAATAGQGGELYQRARRLHENYAKEFKDHAVVSKLLRTKPGTTDRMVAFEDVFKQTVMSGSLDDVKHLRRLLQTSGKSGEQAWKELQGQTIQNLKDEITKNVTRDERGNAIISPARLDVMVRALDQDGKLELMFGKKGAEQVRTVNDIAKDVFTSPPGSVNYSNTATVLAGLLDTALSGLSGMPLPVASALHYATKKVKSRSLSKQVQEALGAETPPEPRAPAFRIDGTPNLTAIEGAEAIEEPALRRQGK